MIYEDEYSKAYVELYEIIKEFSLQDKNRIPEDFINFLTDNMDRNYNFTYDNSKTLQEQNIKLETKALLVKLYEKFLAKPEEKEFWDNYDKECMVIADNKKKQMYNSNDLFKNKFEGVKQTNTQETALAEYKENFFTKFKNYVFKILHINI